MLKNEVRCTLAKNSNILLVFVVLNGCKAHFVFGIERNAAEKESVSGSLFLLGKDKAFTALIEEKSDKSLLSAVTFSFVSNF